MKRHNHLFDSITSFENLHQAYKQAKKSKSERHYVMQFTANLEKNLFEIQEELTSGTYRPGVYRTFTIYDPKMREISCAPFRDRVVHHAICNRIEPIFDKTFVFASYANRKGLGSHIAVLKFYEYSKKYKYVLKCDIKKYFPSIDHKILSQFLQKKIKDKNVLQLLELIIQNSLPIFGIKNYFPGDDLFTPYERNTGITIGNLTSQLFANIYLNEMDHLILEKWHENSAYIRYVDDFVIFHNDKKELWRIYEDITQYLFSVRLKIHENKADLLKVSHGVNFLGYKISPFYIKIKSKNIGKFKRRIKEYKSLKVEWKLIKQSLMSFLGYCKLLTDKRFGIYITGSLNI
jgi:RNA-directed DNA polymerase